MVEWEVNRYFARQPIQHEFNSQSGQIGQSRQWLATAAMFLRSCVVQVSNRGIEPATRYTLRRNTASMMKVGFDRITKTIY